MTNQNNSQLWYAAILIIAFASGLAFFAGRYTMKSKIEATIDQMITAPQEATGKDAIQKIYNAARTIACEEHTKQQMLELKKAIDTYK
jgi:hypothetical protein